MEELVPKKVVAAIRLGTRNVRSLFFRVMVNGASLSTTGKSKTLLMYQSYLTRVKARKAFVVQADSWHYQAGFLTVW